jgi:hypothetical protein
MLAFRKAVGILVSLIALAGLLVTVVLATRRIDQRPRTDDAYLQADLVHMAPDVSGRIVELDVRDNQAVRKGDVLFRIDPDPYRMRVDQARAAVRGLQAKLALIADQVAAQTSKAGAAAIAKLSALIPTMVHELAKADLTPILEARPQVAQELCRALARRQAAGRLSASPELDESVPKHRLTSWFSDRIHRLYDLANAERANPLPDLERGPSRPAPAAPVPWTRGHSFEPIFNLKITEQSMSDSGPSFAFAFRNGLGEALHDLAEATSRRATRILSGCISTSAMPRRKLGYPAVPGRTTSSRR